MALRQYKSFKTICDEISQLLECPVCLDFAKPPVKQCINGHISCFSCGNFLINCPVCRDPFVHRNTLMNKIVGSFVRRCPYRYYGCLKSLSPAEYDGHVETCARRQIRCKICYRNVTARYLRSHVVTYHKDQTWMEERNVLIWNNFNFKQNSESTEIITAFGEMFWYCFNFNAADRSFNFAVQFIGPKLEAKKYIYEVHTDPHNTSDNMIIFKRNAHHYLDSFKFTLLTDGISIKQNFITSLIEDRSFILHLNLYKKNEEPIEEVRGNVTVLLSGS